MSLQGRVGVQEGVLSLQEEDSPRRVELGRPPKEVRQEQTGKCIQQKNVQIPLKMRKVGQKLHLTMLLMDAIHHLF